MAFDGIGTIPIRSGLCKTILTISFGIEEHKPDVTCRGTKGKYETEKSGYDRTQEQSRHQG